jgi:hypothetical protein
MSRYQLAMVLAAVACLGVGSNTQAQLSTLTTEPVQTTTSTTETVQATSQAVPDWVGKLPLTLPEAFAALLQSSPDDYTGDGFQVKPGQFDPFKTYLVQAAWLHGIGCPRPGTRIVVCVFNPVTEQCDFEERTTLAGEVCVENTSDDRTEGLLLAKTGPTENFASAFARIVGIKNTAITELGWDIRKFGLETKLGPSGSHCGGGAPRWNIGTDQGTVFVGCNSSVGDLDGQAWIRQRWTFSPPITANSLAILYDEGTDTGPDFFGAAILDNITINGVIVGKGAVNAR